jgi:hypothetical protein
VTGAVSVKMVRGSRQQRPQRASSHVTVVVAEQAAQPLSALDLAFGATDFWSRFDAVLLEHVSHRLVGDVIAGA